MKKPHELIDTYKDFPKKGIDFKDVLELFKNHWYSRSLF